MNNSFVGHLTLTSRLRLFLAHTLLKMMIARVVFFFITYSCVLNCHCSSENVKWNALWVTNLDVCVRAVRKNCIVYWLCWKNDTKAIFLVHCFHSLSMQQESFRPLSFQQAFLRTRCRLEKSFIEEVAISWRPLYSVCITLYNKVRNTIPKKRIKLG